MKPAAEPEYRVSMTAATHPQTGEPVLFVQIETVREFSSFAYELAVDVVVSNAGATIDLHLGGLTVPRIGRPQPGPARARAYIPQPPTGTVDCTFHVKKRTDGFRLTWTDGALRVEQLAVSGVVQLSVGDRHVED